MKVVKKHAVMMEYVIIAVLVAAAVVVAVIMFGRTITAEMNVATQSMSDAEAAKESQTTIQDNTGDNLEASRQHAADMHNYEGGDDLEQAEASGSN